MATDVTGPSTVDGAPVSTRRERVGWYFYDWANSAFYTTVVTVFLGPYLTAVAKTAAGCAADDPCRTATIGVLGVRIAPGALYPDAVSSMGWAVGYLGGGLLLLVNVAAVLAKDALGLSTADVARYSLASAGLWWAGFTTVPLLRLRNRPATAGPARGSPLVDGFRQLWHTLTGLRAFPLTLF